MKLVMFVGAMLLVAGCNQRAIVADVALIVPEAFADEPVSVDEIDLQNCDAFNMGTQISPRKPLGPKRTYVLLCGN